MMCEMSEFAPTLRVDETAGGVRLSLDGVCSGEGPTLQEAADELVWKLLAAAMTLRTAGMGAFSTLCRPDLELVRFLWELGRIAAAGGDIREHLFGSTGA
jgi:hypothetical protein